jgi:hypothetical protein
VSIAKHNVTFRWPGARGLSFILKVADFKSIKRRIEFGERQHTARGIAEVIGRRLNVAVASKPADCFGFIGPFISIANRYLQVGFSPATWSVTAGAFIGTNSDWRPLLDFVNRNNCYAFSFFAQQSCIFAGGT